MLLMEQPFIQGEGIPDETKQATCNLLNAYIDENSQKLIHEYPWYCLEAIAILKYQCTNIHFSDSSRYNRQFDKVVHKVGESEINYIKIFQNAKALEFSAEKSYSEDQLMHNFLKNIQKGATYSAQIASHQA